MLRGFAGAAVTTALVTAGCTRAAPAHADGDHVRYEVDSNNAVGRYTITDCSYSS